MAMRTLHLNVDPADPDPGTLADAAALLRAGRLVAFPTETVYGLGADATAQEAVESVFRVKGRPGDNPLIVHVADVASLGRLVTEITPLARALAGAFWPGPLALVLDAAPGLAPGVTAGLPTVAVRVPDHPVALGLLHAFGGPLAAPSANLAGRPSPTRGTDVLRDLVGRIAAVLDAGPTPVGMESTVVDARGDAPVVLRQGGVTAETIRAVLDVEVTMAGEDGGPAPSPGLRHRHYAPTCRVELVRREDWSAELERWVTRDGVARVGVLGRFLPHRLPPLGYVENVPGDLAAYGRRLFAALRDAERTGIDVLLVETVDEVGIGRTIMDRLRRASAS